MMQWCFTALYWDQIVTIQGYAQDFSKKVPLGWEYISTHFKEPEMVQIVEKWAFLGIVPKKF